MWSKGVIFVAFISGSSLLLSGNARGGVAFFRDTCVAAVNDFAALETRLPALGMAETDDMPGRVLFGDPKSIRTWTSRAFPGKPGDGFVQLVIGSDAQPFDVCSHISRPGENATEAWAALQKSYPPIEGSVRRGETPLFATMESWAAMVHGMEAYFWVRWIFDPSIGTSELILIKPRLRGLRPDMETAGPRL